MKPAPPPAPPAVPDAPAPGAPSAQQALDLLEMVTRGTGVIVAAVDAELRFLFFNSAYREEVRRLAGVEIRIGGSLPEAFAHMPEQRRVVTESWEGILRGEAVTRRIAFGDPGVYRRTYDVRQSPLRDREGRVVGAGEVAFDVTDAVRAEEELRFREAKTSAVLSSLVEGVIVVDPAGVLVRVNDAARRILGLGEEAAPGRPLPVLPGIVREDGSPFPTDELPLFVALRTSVTCRDVEMGIPTGGGGTAWLSVSARPVLDGEGRTLGAVASFFDLSERKERERRISEAATRFRIVADHTNDWEWWIDPEERFVYSSPSCVEVTGHPREEFLADPELMGRLVHPEDRPAFLERHRGRIDERSRGTASFRIVRPDGSVRWLENAWNPVVDGEGRFLGSRGSTRDITGRVESEARRRMSDRYEAVGKLAGGVAHRINNLMSVVIGYSSSMQDLLPKDDPARVAFEEIEKAGEEVADITARLLSYSRKQLYAPRVVEAGDLLLGMRKRLGEILAGRGELVVEPSPADLRIEVDRAQFRRAVEELVANGRDALPRAGGRITLRWRGRTVAEGEALEAAEGVPVRPGPYAVVEVADNGCGMDCRFLARVLDPFTTTKDFGRGLGIPSVYGFARQSDGYLLLSSRPGEGTTASLLFPTYAPPPPSS